MSSLTATTSSADLQQQLYLNMKAKPQDQAADKKIWENLKANTLEKLICLSIDSQKLVDNYISVVSTRCEDDPSKFQLKTYLLCVKYLELYHREGVLDNPYTFFHHRHMLVCCFRRAKNYMLVEAEVYDVRGVKGLMDCIEYLLQAIVIMIDLSKKSEEARHLKPNAYCLGSLCSREAKRK
ncbi:hypothetical protein Tco_1053785 [Tanacetum coccineum]|uniref:Uncharacterized protein n=1 Tax=Tanacetum coccineum TaxID=301880 RepID=A0ABQ5GV17_9ASTR